MLVDLRSLGITGKLAQHYLDDVNITCNKNGIPFDPEKPSVTSGIRLGTAAVTTRGMGTAEMEEIAGFIYDTLTDYENSKAQVKAGVKALLDRFPLYE
jgi:glycine hydroxymethyltransferase